MQSPLHPTSNPWTSAPGTTPAFPPLPAARRVIAYWRLGDALSHGPWFHLYRAAPKTVLTPPRFGYVLKLINPTLRGEKKSQALDRLGREAFATEQILHPNVIQLLDAELDRAPFFLVQPWLDGWSLEQLFSRAPHLRLTRMLWVLRQIAEGVRAGHERGRVYLGLEPSHVLVGRTGRVTLIGWSQSHPFQSRVWLPEDSLSAARYLPPECWAGDYRAIPASDVYALGMLIYQTMAGRVPVDGASAAAIRNRHAEPIVDLAEAQADCPPRLSRLVHRMLARSPRQRPEFGEVLNELISIEIEHLSDHRLIRR